MAVDKSPHPNPEQKVSSATSDFKSNQTQQDTGREGHAQKSDKPGITSHNAGEEQERQRKVEQNKR